MLLDARRISSPSTLRSTTWRAAHGRHRVGHAPAVAVEHRQRVQQHVAVADAGVPAEDRGVEPAVAVRQLHALRARRGARRVVDRARGVLVALPGLRLAPGGAGANSSASSLPSRQKRWLTLMVSTSSARSGSYRSTDAPECSHDVGDLVGGEPEVDRHQDPAEPAHPEEGGEEAGRVRADDGHPLPVAHPHPVERQGHAPRPRLDLGVGDCAPSEPGNVGLVHAAPRGGRGPARPGRGSRPPSARPSCHPRSLVLVPDLGARLA